MSGTGHRLSWPVVRCLNTLLDRVEKSPAEWGGQFWPQPASAGFRCCPARPSTSRLPYFFMKFRGPKVHPNRPRTAMVCPTWGIVSPTPAAFRGIRSPCAKFGAANLLREKEPLLGYWLALRTAWLYHEEDPGSRLSCRFWRPSFWLPNRHRRFRRLLENLA